jgi:hypothetical protein
MVSVFVIFGLLGIGVVLLIHGTVAKTGWGINLEPVSCPRCHALFPQMREPNNIRQALWGGGTCATCGAEVDKWGREVAARRQFRRSGTVKTKDQLRRAVKRSLIFYPAGSYFCLTLLCDWLGIGPRNGPIPLVWEAWPLWTTAICVALVQAVIFTALFYSASTYLLGRFVFKEHRPSGSSR